MTFYLSRLLREDVSLEQFTDGVMDFIRFTKKDPQNNVCEFDKSLSAMLECKLFNCLNNPRLGLMFANPSAAANILQHPFLIELLFYPRVFQRKHEWSMIYISPISRHLCQQNLISKLPSIYNNNGREIDLNRGIIYLSTIDYFFMSFISYPNKIGPQKPKILNQIISSYKHEKEMDTVKNNKNNIMKFIINQLQINNDNIIIQPPINPFKDIHFHYSQIYEHYLSHFLSSYNYDMKFIEIIGELWFGQSFEDMPIGDRIHTLPLMQDLLFKIMEKQIQFQHNYVTQNKNNSSNDSCLCPQLKCLLKYLYLFFRESFQYFPLDFIAHLRIIIEMFGYILAPWHIQYKLGKPDKNIQLTKQKIKYEYELKQKRKNENVFIKLMKTFYDNSKAEDNNNNCNNNNNINFLNNKNDDRLRDININNTQFSSANEMVTYELDGIENVNFIIWKQYIMEMLPFYSDLINYFIDILLKYDFTHPLKQLCVLKVFHLYKNKQIINLINDYESVIFNHSNRIDKINILNIIQNITFKHISEYKCLPFNNYYKQMVNSQQITQTKAHHLYIKCKKTMQRLSNNSNINNNNNKSYFLNESDNVQIIRYIIGDLELLFNIGPEQQQQLTNLLMTTSRSDTTNLAIQKIKTNNSPTNIGNAIEKNSNICNVWNTPKGQWESYFVLKISQMIYNKLISKNKNVDSFYCNYLAKFHRKYFTDIRVIVWNTILILTYFFCHYIIFFSLLFLFGLAIIIPQMDMINS